MDKQDHNRINSIKAKPTTATSPKSGVAQPSDDILVEIRDDYRKAKKQLKRYNKFIDKHPQATISILLLLSLVVILTATAVLANGGSGSVLGIEIAAVVSLGLLVGSIILAFVSYGRNSSVGKIEHKMKELREEAAQYHRVVALGLGEKNISRDELGLFQESSKEESLATQQNETTKESGGLIALGWIAFIVQFFRFWGAISIIASIVALIISIILVASQNPTNKRNGKVILVIWIVIVSIVFIVAYNNAQQAQQTQVQPSYYSNYQ